MDNSGALSLSRVFLAQGQDFWFTPYSVSTEFLEPWWHQEEAGQADESEHWYSVLQDGYEVARCKYFFTRNPPRQFGLGDMPDGQIDIVLLEVARSMRRRGIGRQVVSSIRALHPKPHLTALNNDSVSRPFWEGIGWRRIEPEWFMGAGLERVTYSEF